MPNIVANRFNAQFDWRGPSHSVSAEELSGIASLRIAARALVTGELTRRWSARSTCLASRCTAGRWPLCVPISTRPVTPPSSWCCAVRSAPRPPASRSTPSSTCPPPPEPSSPSPGRKGRAPSPAASAMPMRRRVCCMWPPPSSPAADA
nr:beta-ketoacyl synthase N-terminal-like domain-containing protein [Azospirillum sp. INR13]